MGFLRAETIMADRSPAEVPLLRVWTAFSARLAVAAASFVALLSLFHHVPVSTAALRGAVTFCALRFAARLALAALQRADASDRGASVAKGAEESRG
jgi:hypothetical protein